MRSIVNESDFNVNNGIYAIKFWAPWCGPCKIIERAVYKLEEEFKNIGFLSVDIDQVPALAKNYKIKSIPTILLIENGKVIKDIAGVQLIEPLRKIFKECSKNGKSEAGENLDNLLVSQKGSTKAMFG